jgi:Na+-translocating ferredoxin:NAD+ oxidoreductase RnfG subunit
MEKAYLTSAARAVDVQASETPNLGIPVDPEVSEFMGAFQEQAVSLDDLDAMLFDEGADDHDR